jgi:bifunctional UDP-N-acetylglucosamine pyrophosphorylase/glucosamine-1-phosphate N-acetyltransferase
VSIATVILAAGQGTRMKSERPKVLHTVGGKPMVVRAVETAERIGAQRLVVVVGHGAETVTQAVRGRAETVLQAQQLGTGHAVLQAADLLRGASDLVVVLYADMPLLRPETLQELIAAQRANAAGSLAMLTVTLTEPRGFGRVVRAADGSVAAIVEEAECTPEQRAIRELNAGVYVFDSAWLWQALTRIQPKSKGEYYLTDLIEIAVADGQRVVGVAVRDPEEVIGVNTRVHLAEAEAILRRRINEQHMLNGVTLIDPATTYIEERVQIGMDTIIYPNVQLRGETVIGKRCLIESNSLIVDSHIGDDCHIKASVIEGATLEDRVEIGPFGHLRQGAYLCEGVHLGNFGEVKNARLGRKTRMGHFSYIGDAEIGEDVNIGAGTITVNYDGVRKHKTIIGDHAFIGSDSLLIAPIVVADNARTAAGAVVTHDVPSHHIAVGVPARMRALKPSEPPDAPES